MGDSTTNDYTQHPHGYEGSIMPKQASPEKMINSNQAQRMPISSLQEDSIQAYNDSAATSLRCPDPITKEASTAPNQISPKPLKPTAAASSVAPTVTSPAKKSSKKSQSREGIQKQEETQQVVPAAADDCEARKQRETEREKRMRKRAEKSAMREEARRIKKERRDKFEELMKKSV